MWWRYSRALAKIERVLAADAPDLADLLESHTGGAGRRIRAPCRSGPRLVLTFAVWSALVIPPLILVIALLLDNLPLIVAGSLALPATPLVFRWTVQRAMARR
jgi:hypothetical protein